MKRKLLIAALLSASALVAQSKNVISEYQDIASNQFQPAGWVEEFLNRQVTGLTGHPEEMGYPFNQQMWVGGLDYTDREIPGGKGWFPYEQVAYYLDGALRCGTMVNNAELKRVVRENIDYVLANADANGQFRITNIDDDWWPLVVFIRIMIEEYDITKDPKLLEAICRHYKATYAEGKGRDFVFTGFSSRSLLHVEHLCTLYGLTGDKWFIETAENLYDTFENKGGKPSSITARGMNEDMTPSGHAVTYHEFLKLPATLYYYTGKEYYRKAYENAVMMLERDHELADGLASGVEHVEGRDPHMAHELCNSIDFNWTLGWGMLAMGEASYGDKMERSMYNAGFASITPDFKAHQYYGAPNMPIASNMSSGFNDNTDWGVFGKKRLCYRPGHDTECCSGNVHRLLPTFINRSSMTSESGVKVNFYIPGTTSIDFRGEGFTYRQETNYPFEFSSKIVVEDAASSKMEMGLRIPGWAESYKILINGELYCDDSSDAAFYKSISRKFQRGDVIEVSFEATPQFSETKCGVAVNYGPLVYSYPIEARTTISTHDDGDKCSAEFPAYEMLPKHQMEWAYALDVDGGIEVVDSRSNDYPWEIGGSPIKLKVKARGVENWKISEWTYVTDYPEDLKLQDEEVTLILEPIGSTLLRITDFPVIK